MNLRDHYRIQRWISAELVFFGILAVVWGMLWGKEIGHRFGDPGLSRDFIFAAHEFAAKGFLGTHGLPVYQAGGLPYAHIPPGPEYVQTVFAGLYRLLGIERIEIFRWHSLWNAFASLGLLLLARAPIKRITVRLLALETPETGVSTVQEGPAQLASWLVILVLMSSVSFQIFAVNPYCVGMFIVNLVAFYAVDLWSSRPTDDNWKPSLLLFSLTAFLGFWMALTPVTSSCILALAAVACFGDREKRPLRLLQLVLILGMVGIVCVGLKLLQNYQFFGSWERVWEDAIGILKVRQGIQGGLSDERYSFLIHLAKLAWRLFYLFGVGALGLLLIPLALKTRVANRKQTLFLALVLCAGLSWQVVMREHAFAHIFLLREVMLPLGVLLAFLLGRFLETQSTQMESVSKKILWIALLQVLVIWGAVVIPTLL